MERGVIFADIPVNVTLLFSHASTTWLQPRRAALSGAWTLALDPRGGSVA
jgi:hypothetical protein